MRSRVARIRSTACRCGAFRCGDAELDRLARHGARERALRPLTLAHRLDGLALEPTISGW